MKKELKYISPLVPASLQAFLIEIQVVCGFKSSYQKFNIFLIRFPVFKVARILQCQKGRISKC